MVRIQSFITKSKMIVLLSIAMILLFYTVEAEKQNNSWKILQGINNIKNSASSSESITFAALYVVDGQPGAVPSESVSEDSASALKSLMLCKGKVNVNWFNYSSVSKIISLQSGSIWKSADAFRSSGSGFTLARNMGVKNLAVIFVDSSEKSLASLLAITVNPPGTRQTTFRVEDVKAGVNSSSDSYGGNL